MPRVRYIAVNPQTRNPFLQLVGLVIGLGTLAIAFVFGAFLLAAFLGLGLIAALFVYLRLWWLRRKMRDGGPGAGPQAGPGGGEFIETEYSVINRSRPEKSDDD
jgi:uncharacterized iron-regulated membrane protein